ncbi:MAG: helix-turn-helix domain-containing protein [Oscillospiraceae bacterium]|nr:helix-turn-helix domain-containing protein [Oscillospiraceae bacterium]
MNSVGERLKKLRLSVKKTLDEESGIFNVSLNTVYRWEHDLCVPRKTALKKIAVFYNTSIEWILNGDINDDIKYKNKCDTCILNPDRNIDREILIMLKKLSDNYKCKNFELSSETETTGRGEN